MNRERISEDRTDAGGHPQAVIHMANGSEIVMELLPENAPNTVNSFIWAAGTGLMDRHPVERIVPGSWIDVSYTAFGAEKLRYLIPNEFQLHPELQPLPSHPGDVCMGGYGEAGLAGCEFFFPLRDCPEHLGVYPVFGHVLSGMEELYRLEKVPTVPVDFPIPGVEVNTPVEPQIIDHVELILHGRRYPEPVRVKDPVLPPNWQ
ncbi:MAG: peptidylprolyl isomerase [Eubacteriales bacterium]|jgi:peptidyl-prolyl cis-trans isomerase B (cyclophilin B)